MGRCRDSEFFPYLSLLPIPLLEDFPGVPAPLLLVSVTSILGSAWRSQVSSQWGICSCLSYLGLLECKGLCFSYGACNADWQEDIYCFGAYFLNLQNFKKKMKRGHCFCSEVLVQKCKLWSQSVHLCPLPSRSLRLAPDLSPHHFFICLWFCRCFTIFLLPVCSILHSYTLSAVFWCCVSFLCYRIV